ncbi:MAG: DUF262 domain-containing protein [Microcoleus sp. CSU_2_2]|nr:DUF262 domain-containing protein [Microcoleus sp. SU_5_3]NJS10794.1 DUF262 domain-containing protein [Microcoleus sp. CSU_2_2]
MPKQKLLEKPEEVSFDEEDEDLDDEIESNGKPQSVLNEISEIIVVATDWTTATILDQLVRDNIQLNPRFQRRDAWDITRKSRFIESIFLGFPIPEIVLASQEKKRGKFVVLDGKQRLLAILQFYGRSETPNDSFALKNLEFRPELNGYTYQALKNDIFHNSVLDALDNQTIRTTLIRNWRTESLLYKIFLRLNLENTPLSPQELRQALHPGDFINFLDDESIKNQALRKILKLKNPDPRMRDVELLLRYVAFHHFLSDYRGNLKRFLDMTCEKLNNDWEEREIEIRDTVSQFENAVQTTTTIFGEENIFRVWLSSSHTYRSKFNRAILDVMVFYFSDPAIRQAAEKNKERVENAFKELCSSSNSEFRDAVEKSTTSIRETHTRLSLWGKALLKVLGVKFTVPELVDNRIIFNGLR